MIIEKRTETELQISASYGEFRSQFFFGDIEEFLQQKDIYTMNSSGDGHEYFFDTANNRIYLRPHYECFMRGWHHFYKDDNKEPSGVILKCKRLESEEIEYLREFMNPEEFEAWISWKEGIIK